MEKAGKLLASALAVLMLTGCSLRTLPPVPDLRTEPTGSLDIGVPLETREPARPQVTVPDIDLPRFTLPETAASETTVPETTALETDVPETEPTEALRGEEPYRPRYGLGTCRVFGGTIPRLIFFLDDDTSSWDPEAMDQVFSLFHEAGQYLEAQADFWGTELRLEDYHYCTQDGVQLRYPGEFGSFDRADENRDVMEVLAACLNFQDAAEMHQYYQEYFGTDQVIYYVLLNKPGRPYATVDDADNGEEALEYAVLFSSYETGDSLYSGAIAHETMHLFGAEDYYDPYGDRPNRLALAREKFPRDLMLADATEAENCTVGTVTAYSVGWLYWPPEEVLDPLWWQ